MSRLKQLIFKDGHEAYVSLFVALVAVILMWSVQYVLSIQLKIGDQVNVNWLVFLNAFVNWYLLFIAVAILFGLAALALAMGSWKKILIVATFIGILTFCGLMAFAMGLGNTYTYAVSANTQYANQTFKIIHAYRYGDMIADADYMLLQCDISGSACKVTDRFDDYRYDARKSKPVSFYVEPSDNALYLQIGNESKLVSKA